MKKQTVFLTAALLLIAAGWTLTPARAADEKPLKAISLQLPWVMLGAYDPFTLALERGYYRDEGINLKINEGTGSLVAAQTVATGTGDFAYADAGTGAILISKGAKMKFVAVFQRKSAFMLIYHPPLEVRSLSDIKDRTIIHAANDAPTQMFGGLLARNGMSWSDVKSAIISPSSYAQAFLQNKDFILIGNSYSTFESIKAREPDARSRYFADFGVNLMSSGILANTALLHSDPALVKGFLAATVKGFQDAVKDPDAAVQSAAKAFPLAVRSKQAINRAELLSALALLDTPETEGRPLGWTTESQWTNMIDLLKHYAGLSGDLPPSAYFTDDFLPQK